MGLEHGENEVIANPGVSEAIRPAARAQDREAKCHNQAPAHAHIQVRAGQAADMVGHTYRYPRFSEPVLAGRPLTMADIRRSGLLVPVQTQSQGTYRPRSPIRRVWNALSRRISALPGLRPRPFGSRCPHLPHETDEATGKLALSAGSGMQCGLQTEGTRTERRANQLPAQRADNPTLMTRCALGLGIVYWAAGRALQKTNLPVKIGVASIQTQSCGGKSTNFFPENSSRPSRAEFSQILERASYGQATMNRRLYGTW